MKKQKIYLLMVLAALFWSGAFIAGKYSVPYIPAFTLTFLRFLFAAIVLFGVMRLSHHPYRLLKAHIPVFIMTGTVGMVGYHILFFTCLRFTTAINSSIIGATNPIITVILAYILLGQKLTRLQVFGVTMSFVGVFLTITGADIEIIRNLDFNKGDLIMLTATFCWALYGIISSKATQQSIQPGIRWLFGQVPHISAINPDEQPAPPIPPIVLTFYSFIVCLIEMIPFVILDQPWTFVNNLPAGVWMAVLYMSLFPSVIGYLVQQIAIKEIGPGRSSIFINLVPLFSIVLAVLLLDEELEPIKLLTALLIITGVIITQKVNK